MTASRFWAVIKFKMETLKDIDNKRVQKLKYW